jgi:hypothetical protein
MYRREIAVAVTLYLKILQCDAMLLIVTEISDDLAALLLEVVEE